MITTYIPPTQRLLHEVPEDNFVDVAWCDCVDGVLSIDVLQVFGMDLNIFVEQLKKKTIRIENVFFVVKLRIEMLQTFENQNFD